MNDEEVIIIDENVVTGFGEEKDPTVPEYVKSISEEDITNWNNKSEFSGNYEDLANVPEEFNPVEHKHNVDEINGLTIPTKVSELENDSEFITKEAIPTTFVELVGTPNNPVIINELQENVIYYATNTVYINYGTAQKQTQKGLYVYTHPTDRVYILKMISLYSSGFEGSSIERFATEKIIYAIGFYPNQLYEFEFKPMLSLKKDANEKITGNYTFAYAIRNNITPTDETHLVNKKYVDGLIPTKTSQLENDSDFATKEYVNSNVSGGDIITLSSNGTSTEPVVLEPTKLYYIAKENMGKFYFRSSQEPETVVHNMNIEIRGLLSINDNGGTYVFYQLTIINGNGLYYADVYNNNSSNVEAKRILFKEIALTANIPEKTSQLENDSNFTTKEYVDENAGGGKDVITLTTLGTSENPVVLQPEKFYYVGIETQGNFYFRSSKEPENVVHNTTLSYRGMMSITDGGSYTTYQLNIINGLLLCYANVHNGGSSSVQIESVMVSNIALKTSIPSVPKKTSQLENDSNFVNEEYVNNAITNAITTNITTALEANY